MSNSPTPNKSIAISPPDLRTASFHIVGRAPYMQSRFSKKMEMMRTQQEGSAARSKKKREARDFERDCQEAMHISTDGWSGIPAASFRNAMIDACRTVGYKMTLAKMSIFVEPDGFDREDGQPLVRIEGAPELSVLPVRNATGVADLRARPLWREWSADVRIQWDGAQFTDADVLNLLARAGAQVGIGEGRPYSRMSNGMGFGLFALAA